MSEQQQDPSGSREARSLPTVVRIIGRLNIGGPARQACFLHQELRRDFNTVLIAGHLDVQEGDMSYLLHPDEPGVEWVGAMSRPIRLWNDLLSMLAILRILRRIRPRIVHTHTAKAGAVGRVAAILAGTPIIIHTYHGHVFRGYFSSFITRMFQWIESTLNRSTTRVIAISDLQARELSDEFGVAPRSKIEVIPTGFDFPLRAGSKEAQTARERLRQEWGCRGDDFVVLWAGRLVPIKDVSLLAQVVKSCAEQRLPFKFVVAGDGPEREPLLEQTQGCGNLTLLGWRKDISELWHAADCALLTSINEGTPAALIEAMAAGKPFVSVAVGGVPDLCLEPVTDSAISGAQRAKNGFLTARETQPIIACLQRLHSDRALADSMGQEGLQFAWNRYSSERLKKDITDLYRKLLEEQKHNHG